MAPVSNAYLELAGQSKADLAAIFAAGGPPTAGARQLQAGRHCPRDRAGAPLPAAVAGLPGRLSA